MLAVFNGKKFKLNDLVDVIVGTGFGVRGNKTEPFKGHFKGVVETERGGVFGETVGVGQWEVSSNPTALCV